MTKIRIPQNTPINKDKLKEEIMSSFPDTEDLEIYEEGFKDLIISLKTPHKESVIRRIIERHRPEERPEETTVSQTKKEESLMQIDKTVIVDQLCSLASDFAAEKLNAKISDFQKCLESFKAKAESDKKELEDLNTALKQRLEQAELKIKENDQVILGLRTLFASK